MLSNLAQRTVKCCFLSVSVLKYLQCYLCSGVKVAGSVLRHLPQAFWWNGTYTSPHYIMGTMQSDFCHSTTEGSYHYIIPKLHVPTFFFNLEVLPKIRKSLFINIYLSEPNGKKTNPMLFFIHHLGQQPFANHSNNSESLSFVDCRNNFPTNKKLFSLFVIQGYTVPYSFLILSAPG